MREVDAEGGKRRLHFAGKAQIGKRVPQQPADKEFQAEIINPLGTGRMRRAGRNHPLVDYLVANGENGRGQPVMRLGGALVLADAVKQRIKNPVPKRPERKRGERKRHRSAVREDLQTQGPFGKLNDDTG